MRDIGWHMCRYSINTKRNTSGPRVLAYCMWALGSIPIMERKPKSRMTSERKLARKDRQMGNRMLRLPWGQRRRWVFK